MAFYFQQLIKSPQMILLKSKEDKVISAINMQLKLLKTYPLNQDSLEVSRGFRSAFMVLLAVSFVILFLF